MQFRQRVQEKLREAMKKQDEAAVRTLRLLNAALLELEKSGKHVSEDAEIDVLVTQIKRRREAIEHYRKAHRLDLAQKEEEELAILQQFLPEPLSEEQIREEVTKIIAEINAQDMKDFGKVMQRAMQKMRGRAEGKIVQQIVREVLSRQ